MAPKPNKVEQMLKEISRLRSQHALFVQLEPEWEFYLSAYEGGIDFAKQTNLFRHMREHNLDYEERVKRMYYENEVENIIDFFTDFIFQETIQRDGGKDQDFYNRFISDVNLMGDTISTFMAEVCTNMQIFGMVFVLVDAPKQNSTQRYTKAQAWAQGIRPYWVLINPNEMLDWVIDAFGNYVYLKRKQEIDQYDPETGAVVTIERFTEWNANTIKITDVDVSGQQPIIISSEVMANPLGEIPIECVRFKKSKRHPGIGNTLMRDLAYCAREILNLTSLKQEFLYRQCFNILAMEAEETLPFKEQEEGESGTANALVYPKGAHAPHYIAPDAAPADKLEQAINHVTAYMYRRVAQDVLNQMFNGGKASGFSQSQSFAKTVPKIATRAEVLESAEMSLMRLTMKFQKRPWTGSIKYKDRYEITNITDWLTQLMILFIDLGLPLLTPTFAKEEMKKAVQTYDGKVSRDVLDQVIAEIDKADIKDWYDKVGPQQGKPPVSAGAQQMAKETGTMRDIEKTANQGDEAKIAKKLRVRGSQL